MSRKAQWPPPIYIHKPTQKERVRIRSGGTVRDITLGPAGSEEAKRKYLEILQSGQNWTELDSLVDRRGQANRTTVVRAIALWWAYADRVYDGRTEHQAFCYPLRALAHFYADKALPSLSRRDLKNILGRFASGYTHTTYGPQRPQSRKVANRNLTRLKTFLRWCAEEGLISASHLAELCLVRGLRLGEAHERDAVQPVPESDLASVMLHLKPVLLALVQVQLMTGARPSELLGLRIMDIIGNRAVLTHHKTSHTGAERIILFGPKALAIVQELTRGRPADQYVFSPRENMRLWREGQRAERKTRVQPSQLDRSKAKPKKGPGPRYCTSAYRQAIVRACKRAGVPPWSPYRLRHNAASRLVEEFGQEGWELARVILGHRTVSTTRIYVAESYKKAEEALRKIG